MEWIYGFHTLLIHYVCFIYGVSMEYLYSIHACDLDSVYLGSHRERTRTVSHESRTVSHAFRAVFCPEICLHKITISYMDIELKANPRQRWERQPEDEKLGSEAYARMIEKAGTLQ